MAHKSKGLSSHTYDITKILSIDTETLTIHYTDAGHAAPQSVTLRADPCTPIAQQTLQAIAGSLSIHGDGNWESAYALRTVVSRIAAVLDELSSDGVTDFSSTVVDLQVLRKVIEKHDSSFKRTLNKFISRILREHHPNGSALAKALQNTSYMVHESRVDLYEDEEVEAIRSAAKGVFNAAYRAQRNIFQELGYDVGTRSWLRISAAKVIQDAMERNAGLEGAPQPLMRDSRSRQIDWAILNPKSFGATGGRNRILGDDMTGFGEALYPPASVLVASTILHCLLERNGLNLSTILRTQSADLVHTGDNHGMLLLAKARNHFEDSLPVLSESNNTLGGLVQALDGVTRFARYYRAQHLDPTVEVVNRLYVEHRADPQKAELLTTTRMHHGWRSAPFDEHWPSTALSREDTGLRFQALRRKALQEVITSNPRGDVHGHSARTRVHYLQNVLPDHLLAEHASAAQDSIVQSAITRFTKTTPADETRSKLDSSVEAGQTVDVITSICTNAGNDPETPEKPCSLGLVACFTCPNGYRTIDHVPGLLATVAFTDIIKDNDPDEWENGEASALNFYAAETLRRFPVQVVKAIHEKTDLAPYVATIRVLYTEMKR
jgi:hypothetical protein